MADDRHQDCAQLYLDGLKSRVVAESGIPTDRYHLGKLILRSLQDHPDSVMQIDGATGQSVTNEEIMKKTIMCASCFNNMGLRIGDVVVIMSPSNLHLSVPFYAAFFTGVIVAPVDSTLAVNEIVHTLGIIQPKLIFCLSKTAPNIQLALNEMESNTTIVTFDKGDYLFDLDAFFEKFIGDSTLEEYKVTDFDASETIALFISTSGTTGLPKAAQAAHKNFVISMSYIWSQYENFPSPVHMTLIGAPLQWLTCLLQYIASPIFKVIRLESSKPMTIELTHERLQECRKSVSRKHKATQKRDLGTSTDANWRLDEYRRDFLNGESSPSYTLYSPTIMTTLIKTEEQCDLTCFKQIVLGGSAVPEELLERLKEITPKTLVHNAFGMTEICGFGFHGHRNEKGNCFIPLTCLQYRIVNPETSEVILEPNVPGELWLKGPTVFKGYYKNDSATRETFAEGNWFKTGDMFVRDENWNFNFVERIKLLLKYKSYQISPVEVENVIRAHPGVLDVAVTSLRDEECGDLPVACVVRRPGYGNIADAIKDLVKESLSDAKQLRGGVVFLDAIPVTASTKVHRRQLKELVQVLERH